MRSRLSLIVLPVTAAALMFASGCGGDDDKTASGGSSPSAGGQTVSVSETDYQLDPSDPTVQPGTVSFRVTNGGGVAHNLEVEGPEGEEELEQDIGPGESDTLTVDLSKPGRYEFYCPVDGHKQAGMKGTLTVG
ncbi:MAG: cupredoxin domain-containing protein [Nocardioidaceae bacterium]